MPMGAVHIGLSGMVTFSKALDVISNNVANLNTPGFKLNTVEFRDLFYAQTSTGSDREGGAAGEFGSGVSAPATRTRFTQGEFRETGNGTDVAIDGNGFLVLRDGSDTVYTRAGQFEFTEDGFLTTTEGGLRVAALGEGGGLDDLSLGDLRISPAKATSTVRLIDNLSSGSTEHVIPDVEFLDATGETHSVTIVATNASSETPRSWRIEVRDAEGETLAEAGEIRFSGDGSPLEGFNRTTFTFEPEGAAPMEVTLDFGEPGSFSSATSFSAGSSSTLRVASQDGVGPGSIVDLSFDEDGVLQIEYSNGESSSGPRLALAWFDDLQSLDQLGGSLFQASADADVKLAGANSDVMGHVRGGTIEISNVDLSEQFTDLIIVQRGFQASSQILNTANEMMQELIENTRSRR